MEPLSKNPQLAHLQANKQKLDINRRYSFGPKSGTINLVDEADKATELTLVFTNPTTSDVKVVASTAYGSDSVHNTIYDSVAEVLTVTGSDKVLKTERPVDPTTTFGMECIDSDRTIEQILKYIALNPTRLAGVSMVSKQYSTGNKDTSNYTKKITTFFVSPFADPERKELNLRPLLDGNKFNAEILTVNFIKQAFAVLLSNEHYAQLIVAKDTELTMTLHFGASASSAQRMYRDLKASDNILRQNAIMG